MANVKEIAAKIATVVIAACAMLMAISCDNFVKESTKLNVSEEVRTKKQVKYENISLVNDFNVADNEFSSKENISGEIVEKEGSSEISRTRFDQDLTFNVRFSCTPVKVYVPEQKLLSDIGLVSFKEGKVNSSSVSKEPFKLVTNTQHDEFVFNANEVVSADATWQQLVVAAKDSALAAAVVKGISFKYADAQRNNQLSNADSTVFNVNLFFNVNFDVEGAKRDTLVRVPTQRIYKSGKLPDNYYKRLENITFAAQFDTTVCKLYTVKENVAGMVVSYNNADVLRKESFRENLDLRADATISPNKLWVNSDNALNLVALTAQSKGNLTSSVVGTNGRFVKTSYQQNYQFSFNEGERVYINAAYEALAYGDTTLAHAMISNIAYSHSKSVRNTALSNADSTVNTVNLFFVATLTRENGVKMADYLIRVPYTRIYSHIQIPDEYETRLESESYIGKFEAMTKKLVTDEQRNIVEEVTVKNGSEIVDRKKSTHDLNLGSTFEVAAEVWVEKESDLTDVQLVNTTIGDDKVNVSTSGNFTNTTRTFARSYKLNAGETVSNSSVYEYLTYLDKNLTYSAVQNIRFVRADAKLNEQASTANRKVADVTLYYDLDVVKNDSRVQTKAAGEEVTTYRVAVPYQRMLYVPTIEDKLISKSYRDVKREIINANTERGSFTEVSQYSESGEKTKTVSITLSRHQDNPALQWIYTVNNSYTTKSNGSSLIRENQSKDGNWTITTRYMQYSSTATNGVNPFNNVYLYDYQKASYVDPDGYYIVTFDYANWNFSEAGSTVSSQATETTQNGVTYLVYDYQNKVSTNYVISGGNYQANASATAKIAIVKPKPEDKLISKSYRDVKREIINANTERGSFTEVSQYSESGEKTKTVSITLSRHQDNPALQWIYTVNNSYTTKSNGSSLIRENQSKDGNWTITTRYMQYSSTATNGVNPFNNVYLYDYQKASYVDPDGYYIVTFDYANWNFSEAGSTVSSQATETTQNGVTYLVYDYQNKVSTNYVISGGNYQANASATAKIAIVKPINRIIPDDWGKIVGMGVSAVPADQVRGEYAQLCFTLRTEKGAVAVITDINSKAPTVNDVLSGYFCKGTFGPEYNSGYYTSNSNRGSYAVNKWAPAIAKDLTDRIGYYRDRNTGARNIRFTTLKMWNWRNGNYSTKVDGYTFAVSDDGTLTVTYKGEVVLQLR